MVDELLRKRFTLVSSRHAKKKYIEEDKAYLNQ